MYTAFDALLQTEISANLAAINGDNEPYRYECLYCGEEVILAAKDSTYTSTHFRHKRGNNDKDCEKYLGQYGLISSSHRIRNNSQQRIEFYYNNNTKCFYLNLHYNEEEISSYEKNNVEIEIRCYRNAHPFISRKINHENFNSKIAESFMLEKFGIPYYVSNTFDNIKREYFVFREDGPSFFKIKGENNNFIAKYVKSNSVYTNVKYFVVWAGSNVAQIRLKKYQEVNVEEEFEFTTLGQCFWGCVITINLKTEALESLFQSWGYNLNSSEKLTLLWPPSCEKDDVIFVSSSNAYLYSSFKLQGHGNTNASNECIHQIMPGVFCIDLSENIRIVKKNIEINIKRYQDNYIMVQQDKIIDFLKQFKIPENNSRYFKFSKWGVEELQPGEQIYLTPDSTIVEYINGYLIRTIFFEKDKLTLEHLYYDALAHYRVMAPYSLTDIPSLPEQMLTYVQKSQSEGTINNAVKRIIEEEHND